jgi:hypothetical protein
MAVSTHSVKFLPLLAGATIQDSTGHTKLTITDDHHSQWSIPSFVFWFEISASDIDQILLHNAPINPD